MKYSSTGLDRLLPRQAKVGQLQMRRPRRPLQALLPSTQPQGPSSLGCQGGPYHGQSQRRRGSDRQRCKVCEPWWHGPSLYKGASNGRQKSESIFSIFLQEKAPQVVQIKIWPSTSRDLRASRIEVRGWRFSCVFGSFWPVAGPRGFLGVAMVVSGGGRSRRACLSRDSGV